MNLGTLPRNWERAFGYGGDARYVAFYWSPASDEAMYDDGQTSGDGAWSLFLTLCYAHPELDQRYNLGSSEREADDWLLLDREMRRWAVLPRAEARVRLAGQWPASDADPTLRPAAQAVLSQPALREAPAHGVARRTQDLRPCGTCFYSVAPGWLRAEDGGFDPCPVCDGQGFLPTTEE